MLSRLSSARRAAATDLVVLLAVSALAAWWYCAAHAALAPAAAPSFAAMQASPAAPVPGFGWWSGWDQGKYLEAAEAWTRGALDPALHWYLPGYPLLGAAFAAATPGQPFFLPDLLCLLASLWLCAALGGRMAAGVPGARVVAAVVFLLTAVLPPRALSAWVVPWTTTPETPLLLLCLLATLRCAGRPRAADAFVAAAAGVTIGAFRPADAVAVLAVCAAALLVARQITLRIAAAAIAGAAIPLIGFGAAYLAIYGWRASDYVTLSGAIGFEWRLLPLRWVTLMIDPQPLFPDGDGLAVAFPWILPGVAGMLACLLAPGRGGRLVHGVVAGACAAECAAFLAYRDLHPPSLWSMGTAHYFKWMLPVFGLYAALLLHRLATAPRWPALAAAVAVAAGLGCWRVEIRDAHPLPPASLSPDTSAMLSLPNGLKRVDGVVFARAAGNAELITGWDSTLTGSGAPFHSIRDFRVFLTPGIITLLPLRPMPRAPAELHFTWTVALDPAVPPMMARQAIVWGLPCWIRPGRPACRPRFPVAPPPLPPDGTVLLGRGGDADRFLGPGWSGAEAEGRWTVAPHASLDVAAPPGPLTLSVSAQGFVPDPAVPETVQVFANAVPVATWSFGDSAERREVALPPGIVAADGGLRLDFVPDHPRSPDSVSGGGDTRLLGIYLRSVSLTAAASAPPPPPG